MTQRRASARWSPMLPPDTANAFARQKNKKRPSACDRGSEWVRFARWTAYAFGDTNALKLSQWYQTRNSANAATTTGIPIKPAPPVRKM